MDDWKIIIVLDRMRSAFNVGNILRVADACGVEQVIGCGYTPLPPHPKLAKTAMGAEALVKCRRFATSLEAVEELRREGAARIFAVDALPGRGRFAWDVEYPAAGTVAFVFGNEALGILPETVERCHGVISLPMFGTKSSINVGNACAAVLYAVMAKRDPEVLKSWRLENENSSDR